MNRGGDRQANAALDRIVLTTMSGYERTRTYITRRRGEGKNPAEIMDFFETLHREGNIQTPPENSMKIWVGA